MYWAPGLCDIWGVALFNGAAQVPPSGDPACALLSQEGTRLLLPNPWSVLFGLTRRGGTHCPRTRGTPRQRRCWRRPTVALCRSPGLRGTRTYRCTARSKAPTRTPAIKENTKACSWGPSKGFLRKETRACWQTGRGPRRRPRPQRQPSMNMEWTLPRHRPRAPAYTMAFRVLLPQRTHNGLGNRRTTPSPRGKLPGSPKPPGTWACTAHPEALSPARCPSLEASSGLITGPGGRPQGGPLAMSRAGLTHWQGLWEMSLAVGTWSCPSKKKSLSRAGCSQFRRKERCPVRAARSAHTEDIASLPGSPEAHSSGRSRRTPAQPLEPGSQFETYNRDPGQRNA